MDHLLKRNYTETNEKYMLFVEMLDVVFRKIDVYIYICVHYIFKYCHVSLTLISH